MPTAEDFLPVIRKAAKAFAQTHRLPPWEDWEDLVPLGWEKVAKEIHKRKGEDIRWGVWQWCWWVFLSHARKMAGRHFPKDLDWRQGGVEGREQKCEPDPAWIAEAKADALQLLWEGNRGLSFKRARSITYLYHLCGLKMREVGEIWHISEPRVSQILKPSMERMKLAAKRVCA